TREVYDVVGRDMGRVDRPRAGAGRVEEQSAVIHPEDADRPTVVQELRLAERGLVLEARAPLAPARALFGVAAGEVDGQDRCDVVAAILGDAHRVHGARILAE